MKDKTISFTDAPISINIQIITPSDISQFPNQR
jgi:hypothetical protein